MRLRNVFAVVVGLLLAGTVQAGLVDGLVSYWALEDTGAGAVDSIGGYKGAITDTVAAGRARVLTRRTASTKIPIMPFSGQLTRNGSETRERLRF